MKIKVLLFYGAILLVIAATVSWFVMMSGSTPAPGGGMLNNSLVVARVNGVDILAEAVNRNLGPIDENLLSDPNELRQLQKDIIEHLITRQLIKEEALRRNVTVSEEEVSEELQRQIELHGKEQLNEWLSQSLLTMDDFRSELRDRLLRDRLMREIRDELKKDVIVSDEEITQYYVENRELYDISEVAHIYLRIPAPAGEREEEAVLRTANYIIRQLVAGADFASLARRYSEDPESRARGGSLGPLNSGLFSAAFLDAAIDLPAGAFTEIPVKVQDGIHIIKRLNEKYLPLDQVRDVIRESIAFPRLDMACTDFMSRLRREAKVQILLK